MKSNSIDSKKLIVSGLVQGVGFRYCTAKVAKHFNIKGSVQNLPEGSVKIIAQGQPSKLNQFIIKIRKSPTPFGKVNNLKVKTIQISKLNSFQIKS
ncbi:acylphosphatase [Philodulcilactobacillus myokoensis]|uniref:acylphosphatase n=1 Tax=Philodulcilactobacillus myokoensis TaxID=2929573 RepID=A0A9W6B265_9LACO|nr:acylphosphatase [Philodulcilactobacillus myokoensis]GLB46769.1 acylphosphatase [Philodulcilactobacillus myokoensis]